MFANNLTIKMKLYALAGLIVLCLSVLAVVALKSFSNASLLNETLELSQASKTHMLLLRRNEKDFLARLDMKYQKKFDAYFDTLLAEVDAINENIQALELGKEQAEKISDLTRYLQSYSGLFHKLVVLHEKNGLSSEAGKRGQLRDAAHQAEELLGRFDAKQLTIDLLMLRRNEKDFMLRKHEKYLAKFEKNYALFEQHIAESDRDDMYTDDIAEKMAAYHAAFNELSQYYKQLGLTPNDGVQGKMRSAVRKTENIFDAVNQGLEEKISIQSQAIYNQLLLITAGLIVLIVAAVLSIAYSVNARLGLLQHHLSEVALKSGDLSATLRITGNDEVTRICQLFNQFIANMKDTFSQIPNFSDSLAQASEANNEVSARTYQLASSQQAESSEVAGAVQQMMSSSEGISEDIHVAADSAQLASESVSEGKQVFKEVSMSINNLSAKLQSSAEVTKDLEKNSNSISAVLEVIRGIAEQTNLLALNAAIEAARAGEQGRGFAVVADEVRTLASRTQDSTTQIQSLVENFQANVKDTVDVMQEGSVDASETAQNASNAIQVLDHISRQVSNIFELNTKIASASQQQCEISRNINSRILNINETAKETAEQASGSSQSSANINHIVLELQTLVSSYKF